VHVRPDLPDLPALLDLVVIAARKRPTVPRLLGRYPVPELHLVGAGVPPGPRAPSRWRPGPAPLQHGVDYTFARRHGLKPVRWQPGTAIAVRLAGAAAWPTAPESADAVDAVVAELRELTGLDLRTGPPLEPPIDLRLVPEQQIHVAYLPSAEAQQVRRLGGDRTPGGGAVPGQDGAWYRRGWAIVDTELAADPDSPRGEPTALSAAGLAILRHQLGHALGLGHAGRRWVLMHERIPVNLGGYARGDRHGLALLGVAPPVPRDLPLPPACERTVSCR
jgi:hypothetical protein